MTINFDNAATTSLHPEVIAAMSNAMAMYGNPSSVHALGRKTKASIESERRKIAQFIGCTPGEIVFTSGGTESDNTAILGTIWGHNIRSVISSKLEHPAVLEAIKSAQDLFNVQAHWVRFSDQGEVDLVHLEELLQKNPKSLVSLMHINNEIGNILDINEVGKVCQKYEAIFHTDAVQSLGNQCLNLSELPVDLVSGSAHKIHGPKGMGFLYVRKGIKIHPWMMGGKQEREHRGGTENFLGIIGLGKAVETLQRDFEAKQKHLKNLKSYFIEQLKQVFPNMKLNGKSGDLENSSHAIVNVGFPDFASQKDLLLFQLDLKGIMVSGGSACSSGSVSGSHVLSAMGVQETSVRFSFGMDNTIEEIDNVIAQLRQIKSGQK